MEIERKFRVRSLPEKLENFLKKEIEQGYLCGAPVLRIRKSNEDYILTLKSKYSFETGEEIEETSARRCEEVEVRLDGKAYAHLKEKTDGRLILKTRYLIPYGGYTIELDVFDGDLKGLIFAEVEFQSEKESGEFVPPEWFGEDVTFDRHFSNNYLAHEFKGSYEENPF